MSNEEVLVVASKLKAYIKSQADMNTAANVMGAMSDVIRQICDNAIESAKADKRKTVKDRDIKLPTPAASDD